MRNETSTCFEMGPPFGGEGVFSTTGHFPSIWEYKLMAQLNTVHINQKKKFWKVLIAYD
jgi:hypothetical protein